MNTHICLVFLPKPTNWEGNDEATVYSKRIVEERIEIKPQNREFSSFTYYPNSNTKQAYTEQQFIQYYQHYFPELEECEPPYGIFFFKGETPEYHEKLKEMKIWMALV